MWVFGYGSLMWDGWEAQFACVRRSVGTLRGYRRVFDKASVKNWGSRNSPCPTLNLATDGASVCVGVAFEFPDNRKGDVLESLKRREGKDFGFPTLPIILGNEAQVDASVPVYRGPNLIHGPRLETAAMMRRAAGKHGPCLRYVQEIAEALEKLGINDPAVTEFWRDVQDVQNARGASSPLRN